MEDGKRRELEKKRKREMLSAGMGIEETETFLFQGEITGFQNLEWANVYRVILRLLCFLELVQTLLAFLFSPPPFGLIAPGGAVAMNNHSCSR